jgi:hypothetical protein
MESSRYDRARFRMAAFCAARCLCGATLRQLRGIMNAAAPAAKRGAVRAWDRVSVKGASAAVVAPQSPGLDQPRALLC